MQPGDIAPMKSAKVALDNAEFGFKAKNSRKGDRLVFMYIGHYDHEQEPLDPEQVLRDLGWVPKEEVSNE